MTLRKNSPPKNMLEIFRPMAQTSPRVLEVGMDLEKLNHKELVELRTSLDKKLQETAAEARNQAIDELRVVARNHGFTLEELIGARPRKSFPRKKS